MFLGERRRRWSGMVRNEILDGLGCDDVRLDAWISDNYLEYTKPEEKDHALQPPQSFLTLGARLPSTRAA